jgi:hypothetical protein
MSSSGYFFIIFFSPHKRVSSKQKTKNILRKREKEREFDPFTCKLGVEN